MSNEPNAQAAAPHAHVPETRATGGYDERDQLTGVRGYYTLLNNCEDYFGEDVYVILCDLDNFRLMNDAYGENVGNDLLARIGQVIQRNFGDTHVFRFGSDEFLIVNEFFDEDAVLEKINRLDRQVAAVDFEGSPLHITLSYGYVHGKIDSSERLHEAVRFADRKMYEAKRLGKARAVGVPLEGDPVLKGGRVRNDTLKAYEMDELTGLANLMYFRANLEQVLARQHDADDAENDCLTIVYFNVENFKGYNQKFGFTAGDELLLLISEAIQNAFPGRLAARVSADQFMVAARMVGVEEAAKKVRAEFRKRQKDSSIWLKAGVYVTDPLGDTDVGVACDRAKIACDSLKGRRDRYVRFYDDALKHDIVMHRYVLDNFEKAMREGWIKVFYQPIVRVATGEICEEECLARWVDPDQGIISPGGFIPVLEEARLIEKLDLYIVDRACQNLVANHYDPEQVAPLSINLSRLDFELCDDVINEVEKIIEHYGLPRELFSVEVTENALTGNAEFLKGEIDRFRDHGFEVWMDDFGSGYSSLNLLKEYNFDVVKIDMGFLRGFENGDEARILLANVINMAKELGLHTLVEGVETEEQYHFLKSIGCGRAQGYYFGKPQAMADVLAAKEAGRYLEIERNDKRDYFAAMGNVNLQRPDPMVNEDGSYIPGDVPAAVFRKKDGVYEYLNVSDAYETFLKHIGLASVEDSEQRLNDPTRAEHIRMEEALARAVESGTWEWSTTFSNGVYCALRVKVISALPKYDSIAAVVIAVNVQESSMMAFL